MAKLSQKGMGNKRTGKGISPTNKTRDFTKNPSTASKKINDRGTENPC